MITTIPALREDYRRREGEIVSVALAQAAGNASQAANILEIPYSSLMRILQRRPELMALRDRINPPEARRTNRYTNAPLKP